MYGLMLNGYFLASAVSVCSFIIVAIGVVRKEIAANDVFDVSLPFLFFEVSARPPVLFQQYSTNLLRVLERD